mgnify:CR=1 FL=1|jgi:hypothetical protein
MTKINDLDLKNRKESCNDIITDSLWIINERGKWGKHSNFYHWNFIPQIPNQLIKRYTKKWDYVLDMFIWSWTTAVECENLWRNVIWVDIQENLIERLDKLIDWKIKKKFLVWDSTKEKTVKDISKFLKENWKEYVDLVLLHPPYFDIVKFSQKKEDLSNTKSVDHFLEMFKKVLENSKKLLKKWWYVWIVIGDKYQNSERIPLWFLCMQKAQEIWLKLKSIIVKNIEWNRGKLWVWWIWRYRALSSDYYIFKHEYILIFKK